MRPPRTSSLALALGLVALASGCTPSCERVCEKLVDCPDLDTTRMTALECQRSCEDQQSLLDRWTDAELRHAFDAELDCLGASSCEEIADGVCYDADLWAF